jgi:hypothetical protein
MMSTGDSLAEAGVPESWGAACGLGVGFGTVLAPPACARASPAMSRVTPTAMSTPVKNSRIAFPSVLLGVELATVDGRLALAYNDAHATLPAEKTQV